jgi:type IV pilus assembly protein PilM
MKNCFIKKNVCIPKYLSMASVAIDMGNNFLRYLELDNDKKNPKIKNYGELQIQESIIKDGDILDKEKLISALKQIRQKVTTDFVKVSIPEDKNYIFNIKIPRVKEKEIRQILEFKIEENVPLKLDESFFEYEIISEMSNKKELFLNVTVVPKKVIEDYTDIIKSSGFLPISFEVESKMVCRSVISYSSKKTFMIVNIKDNSTVFSIVSGGVVVLTSTISIGNNVIADLLYRKNKKLDEKVFKIPDELFDVNQKYDNESFNSLLNVFSVFKDEINKFIKYWLSQGDRDDIVFDKNIKKIIFCGRASALLNFCEYTTQGIDISISLADVWVNVFEKEVFLPDLKFIDSLDYPILVGLALPFYKNA